MKKWIWILIVLLMTIAALIFPYNWLNGGDLMGLLYFIDVKTVNLTYGELGDFIGGVIGTVVAGIACVLVYLTYTRQSETAEKQQFESTFFNLIRIHKENLESLQYTEFYSPIYPKTEEYSDVIEYLKINQWKLPDEQKGLVKTLQLRGEEAMLEEYKSNTDRDKLLNKYYHLPWFNSIYMVLKYLKDNGKGTKSFYTKYFYSQIAKTEWWFLYGIYLYVEEKPSNNEKDTFEELANKMDMFDYGYSYISEKYHVTSANIYDKTIKHEII